MKITGKLVFSLSLALLFAYLIYLTMGYNSRARMVPLIVLVPALGFAVLQVAHDLRDSARPKRKEQSSQAATKPEAEKEDKEKKIPGGEKQRRELIAIAWLLGFFAAIILLGLTPAIPLFVLVFMRFFGRESWQLSVIFAVGCTAFVYIVFVWLLQNELYPGILLPMIMQ